MTPAYHAPVVHVKDASVNSFVISQLLNKSTSTQYIETLEKEYSELRTLLETNQNAAMLSYEEAQKRKPDFFN